MLYLNNEFNQVNCKIEFIDIPDFRIVYIQIKCFILTCITNIMYRKIKMYFSIFT